MGDLQAFGADCQIDTGAEDQDDDRPAPDDAVDRVVDAFNGGEDLVPHDSFPSFIGRVKKKDSRQQGLLTV